MGRRKIVFECPFCEPGAYTRKRVKKPMVDQYGSKYYLVLITCSKCGAIIKMQDNRFK